MTLAASRDSVGATRRRGESNGATFWLTTFLGGNRFTVAPDAAMPSADTIYPMAFLVEQDPSATVQSHFHQADQFQVIVGGSATLAQHPVRDLSVHFAGAYSPYGPIRATDQGVDYFTLRNGWDPGARYMPGARDTLRAQRRAPHREAVVAPQPTLSAAELAGCGAVACDSLIALEEDGLAAWRYRMPPHAGITGPDPRSSRGQTWLVVGGSLAPPREDSGAAPLPAPSCLFVFPDDAPLAIVAGAEGAELLCLQYPRHIEG
ncbi:MAG: hypothetical protein WDO24_16760 [Pseudomonadota bacterium]